MIYQPDRATLESNKTYLTDSIATVDRMVRIALNDVMRPEPTPAQVIAYEGALCTLMKLKGEREISQRTIDGLPDASGLDEEAAALIDAELIDLH